MTDERPHDMPPGHELDGFREFMTGEVPADMPPPPQPGPDCLPLDRVFIAIGLEPAEEEHLAECDFCQGRVESFAKVPLEDRRPAPAYASGRLAEVLKPTQAPVIAARLPWWQEISRRAALIVCVLLGLGLVAESIALGKVLHDISTALAEASQLRLRLDAMHKAVGLDRSFRVDFGVEQPDKATVNVQVDPALVTLAEASYDAGVTWKKLYEGGGQAAAEPIVQLKDEHVFTPPAVGRAEASVKVRVQYVPAVLEAFPEYAGSDKMERQAEFEVAAAGIQLGATSTTTAAAAPSVTQVDATVIPWELTNSTRATVAARSDPKSKDLLVDLALKDIGEWATLSHPIPGATPSSPTVSLKDLTHVEVRLVWDNPAEVALETKLVDDFGKVTGAVKFLAPGKGAQTLRIPIGSMKPYFGVSTVDLSRVRRVELTFARKTPAQAAEGTVRIEGVALVSTKPLPAEWTPPAAYATLESLALKPDLWKTDQGGRAAITLSAEGAGLACKVNMPYDAARDKELPWTSLWTQPQGKSFPSLQAIEMDVRWEGEAPITLEPQLSMGSPGDTYGTQVRLQPTKEFQKITVFPQQLKYFWTFAGETSAKGMDLGQVSSFHLGIGRKAANQAQRGTLFVKSIRFLGPGEKPAGK